MKKKKNRLLKELDLSHNNFGDEGGKFLGQYIASNDTLENLDISWNNFRKKAAKEIALGIKVIFFVSEWFYFIWVKYIFSL